MKPDMRWVFLGFSGRLSRLPYLLGLLFLLTIGFLIYNQLGPSTENSLRQGSWTLVLFGYSAVSVWSSFALAVKRLHDIGIPGPVSLTLLLPVVSLLVFVGLCLWPGAAGANSYGDETNRPKS